MATAESCTGGLCSSLITDISGSSAIFHGGIIAYSNFCKRQILGVPAHLIEQYGAVSSPVAAAMALGVQKLLEADFAIAITGIAGPTGGTQEKPVGTAFVGIASPGQKVATWNLLLTGDRSALKLQFAQNSLNLAWQTMRSTHEV